MSANPENVEAAANAKRSWAVRSYLWPIMKGMGVSFKHLFKKPVTFDYPEVKPRVSERFRGEHRLTSAVLGIEVRF